jgi:hypothetical protein
MDNIKNRVLNYPGRNDAHASNQRGRKEDMATGLAEKKTKDILQQLSSPYLGCHGGHWGPIYDIDGAEKRKLRVEVKDPLRKDEND